MIKCHSIILLALFRYLDLCWNQDYGYYINNHLVHKRSTWEDQLFYFIRFNNDKL